MRRIGLVVTVAAMMAVLVVLASAPVLAQFRFDGDRNDRFENDRNGFFVVRDDDRNDFFGDRDRFDNDGGGVSFDLGDTENESGDIETENSFSIEGDNNNACLGQSQFGNSGNFTNQQGTLQFDSDADDLEFGGGEFEFGPENETACEQLVEQAAAASSWGW